MKPKPRRFKKRLAIKQDRRKIEPVLSISFIKKEYLVKAQGFFKRIIALVKNLRPITNN